MLTFFKEHQKALSTHLVSCLVFVVSGTLSGGKLKVPGGVEQREEYPVSQPPLLVASAALSLNKEMNTLFYPIKYGSHSHYSLTFF